MNAFSDLTPENTLQGATDGTLIGNVGDRLKVDATVTSGIATLSSKLRYLDMNTTNGGIARNANVSTTFKNVFSVNGSGLFLYFGIKLEESKNWTVKLSIDGEQIFGTNGLNLSDVDNGALYSLKKNFHEINISGLGFHLKTDMLHYTVPCGHPIAYNTNVTISVKRNSLTKKFKAGLVSLTRES